MMRWIAATALQHGLTLVTRNVRDFVHINMAVQPFGSLLGRVEMRE